MRTRYRLYRLTGLSPLAALLAACAPLRDLPYRQKVRAWGGEPARFRVTQPGPPRKQWHSVERWR